MPLRIYQARIQNIVVSIVLVKKIVRPTVAMAQSCQRCLPIYQLHHVGEEFIVPHELFQFFHINWIRWQCLRYHVDGILSQDLIVIPIPFDVALTKYSFSYLTLQPIEIRRKLILNVILLLNYESTWKLNVWMEVPYTRDSMNGT